MGVDLLDFWRGDMSARRLDVLIRHLPPDSELVKKARPDITLKASWDSTAYLVADLIDSYAAVNFKNPKPIKRPDQIAAEMVDGDARVVRLMEWRAARRAMKAEQASSSG